VLRQRAPASPPPKLLDAKVGLLLTEHFLDAAEEVELDRKPVVNVDRGPALTALVNILAKQPQHTWH